MTSDAKIGLLLGLVFIFVIAFIINGLPGLHRGEDTNKLTTNMVGLQNNSSGLGANERKVALEPAGYESATESADARFVMTLPQNEPAAPEAEPVANPAVDNPAAAPVESTPVVSVEPPAQTPAQNAPATKPGTVPSFYVVEDGDSLSSIAKKVYGEELGNKLINVNAIFQANSKTLPTADSLQVGQKLVIPALNAVEKPAPTPQNTLPEKIFAKVSSIGKKNIPTAPEKPAQITKTATAEKSGKVYIVKEGDSLWRIASEQLGDGNRYKEIVKLNNNLLSSEDDIKVDMKLKLPAK